MNVLYAIMTSIIAAALFPVAVAGALLGRPGLLNRLVPPKLAIEPGRPRLWIHAASVGELGIALALAGEVKKSSPGTSVVISAITSTGLERIRRAMEGESSSIVDAAFFAPLDCPLVTGAFVRRIAPASFALVETELWPALIGSLSRRGVPVSLVNGRLGRRAFRRYMIVRGLARPMVERISLFCVQSRKFSRRLMLLGAPPERVEVIGNIKFDSLPDASSMDAASLRRDFGIPADMALFVAGSTRPGEEEVLVRAFERLSEQRPGTGMILVPRHLNRVTEIARLLDEHRMPFVARTSGETMARTGRRVMVLDTMGELIAAYGCADVVFVGGSLRDFGGHNPLEPAALGKPVLFGPYMEQIGSKELLARGAAEVVHDGDDTAELLEALFADDGRQSGMGAAGMAVVRSFQGTLARTVRCMRERGVL